MATNTDTEDLGLRVEALRSKLGITVEQLAADAKMSSTTLSRRLSGDGLITVAELNRLSSALNVKPASWEAEEVSA